VLQQKLYPEGPQEVKLGTSEMKEQLHNFASAAIHAAEECEVCLHSPEKIWDNLKPVADLRNTVCHPGPLSPDRIDYEISKAHAYAVFVRDEKRAVKFREIRDELQRACIEVHRDIGAFQPSAGLLLAKPWAPHHQRLFDSLQFAGQKEKAKYSPAVLKVAEEWERKWVQPGQLRADFVSEILKDERFMGLANVREDVQAREYIKLCANFRAEEQAEGGGGGDGWHRNATE
jgi:hypothetical protein